MPSRRKLRAVYYVVHRARGVGFYWYPLPLTTGRTKGVHRKQLAWMEAHLRWLALNDPGKWRCVRGKWKVKGIYVLAATEGGLT